MRNVKHSKIRYLLLGLSLVNEDSALTIRRFTSGEEVHSDSVSKAPERASSSSRLLVRTAGLPPPTSPQKKTVFVRPPQVQSHKVLIPPPRGHQSLSPRVTRFISPRLSGPVLRSNVVTPRNQAKHVVFRNESLSPAGPGSASSHLQGNWTVPSEKTSSSNDPSFQCVMGSKKASSSSTPSCMVQGLHSDSKSKSIYVPDQTIFGASYAKSGMKGFDKALSNYKITVSRADNSGLATQFVGLVTVQIVDVEDYKTVKAALVKIETKVETYQCLEIPLSELYSLNPGVKLSAKNSETTELHALTPLNFVDTKRTKSMSLQGFMRVPINSLRVVENNDIYWGSLGPLKHMPMLSNVLKPVNF